MFRRRRHGCPIAGCAAEPSGSVCRTCSRSALPCDPWLETLQNTRSEVGYQLQNTTSFLLKFTFPPGSMQYETEKVVVKQAGVNIWPVLCK